MPCVIFGSIFGHDVAALLYFSQLPTIIPGIPPQLNAYRACRARMTRFSGSYVAGTIPEIAYQWNFPARVSRYP